jgi:hypothetical protein
MSKVLEIGLCCVCNVKFEYIRKAKYRKFCSESCRDRNKYQNRIKKNPHGTGYKNKIRCLIGNNNYGPCSRCGWYEECCDIHHINGRMVDNCHGLWNLSILCPNCHRLADRGVILPKDIVNLEYLVKV